MATRQMKIAYVITKREGQDGDDKSFWTRIGVAFVNSDGSINVKLEAFPVNGELQLRDYVSEDERAPRGNNDRNRNELRGRGR